MEDPKADTAHFEDVDSLQEPVDTLQRKTPWQCLAQNPWIILFCLYGNLGALMYGFDNLVMSLALSMPAFE
jgi:SP family general alpha glucoside:H+ symporter-like MFS transporter